MRLRQTPYRSVTSPMLPRGKVLSFRPSSLMFLRGASLAGAQAAQPMHALFAMLCNRPFINASQHKINGCITQITDRNFCRSNTPNDLQRRRLHHQSAALGIPMTMPWPTRPTVYSRPKSSTGVGPGAALMPLKTPPLNGLIGATIAACWSLSGLSLQLKQRQTSMPLWKDQTWSRNYDKSTSGKQAAVQPSSRLSAAVVACDRCIVALIACVAVAQP